MEEKFLNELLLLVNGHNKTKSRDFISNHYNSLLDDDKIEMVYKAIVDSKDIDSSNNLILFVIRNYIKYQYNPTESFVKYLKENDVENVINLFRNNQLLGKSLLQAYYLSFVLQEKNIEPEAKDLIKKFDVQEIHEEVVSLSAILRDSFELIYNLLIMAANNTAGVNQIMYDIILGEAYIWGYDEIEEATQNLKEYKNYLSRLAYADIYADILAAGMEHDYDKVAVRIVDKAIRNNDFSWPEDEEEAKIIINYFGYLCTCEEKRIENMKTINSSKEISEDKKKLISKINPISFLDESDIINKR